MEDFLFLFLRGISRAQWESVMETRGSRERLYFGDVMTLGTDRPKKNDLSLTGD